MIGIPFIIDLNKSIFSKSTAIGGRFHVCPNMGTEINMDDLNEVIKDLVAPVVGKKYPLVLMMPPVCYGDFTKDKEWGKYHFIYFFLKTTYYDSNNQVQNININTQTSTHTIPQDWHDMDRCAKNYVNALNIVTRKKGLINTHFRLDQEYERIIRPVSNIGVDRASGVRLDCRGSVFMGCELEDYNLEDLLSMDIPSDDSHPEHTL